MSTSEITYVARRPFDVVGEKRGITFTQPSMTQQSFKDDCNINKIIERFKVTGRLGDQDSDPTLLPSFDDFSSGSARSLQNALNKVVEARELFDSLPSALRERFGYSPVALLRFLGDSKNRDEAVRLGLVRADAVAPESAPASGVAVETDNAPVA